MTSTKLICLCIGLIAVVWCAYQAVHNVGKIGREVLPTSERHFKPIDLGIIYSDKAEYGIHLSAEHSHPLKLRSIAASCGCTTIINHPEKILPGHPCDIQVAINTSHFHASFTSKIIVSTNDGNYEYELSGWKSDLPDYPISVSSHALLPSAVDTPKENTISVEVTKQAASNINVTSSSPKYSFHKISTEATSSVGIERVNFGVNFPPIDSSAQNESNNLVAVVSDEKLRKVLAKVSIVPPFKNKLVFSPYMYMGQFPKGGTAKITIPLSRVGNFRFEMEDHLLELISSSYDVAKFNTVILELKPKSATAGANVSVLKVMEDPSKTIQDRVTLSYIVPD